MLVVSLGIYFFTVVAIDLPATPYLNLDPGPDAVEYFAQAVSLQREGSFRIHIAGANLPSRYPFGYSLLMVPLLKIGGDPTTVPFLVNRILGLLLILLVFAALWGRSLFIAAGLATLVLVTQASFIILARSPMSELASICLLFLACDHMHRSVVTGKRYAAFLGALLLGVSTWFRISNLFFFPLLLIPALSRGWSRMRQSLVLTLQLGLVATIGALPLLIFQARVLGSPFRTGYHFWVPYYSVKLGNAFNLDHFFPVSITTGWSLFSRSRCLRLPLITGRALTLDPLSSCWP